MKPQHSIHWEKPEASSAGSPAIPPSLWDPLICSTPVVPIDCTLIKIEILDTWGWGVGWEAALQLLGNGILKLTLTEEPSSDDH